MELTLLNDRLKNEGLEHMLLIDWLKNEGWNGNFDSSSHFLLIGAQLCIYVWGTLGYVYKLSKYTYKTSLYQRMV
jgi:hypothetical protein